MPPPEVIATSIATGVLLGGMQALTALGLSLMLGVMRLVNLAHGEFLLLGAYLGWLLLQHAGVDPLAGMPLVGALVALAALPFYRMFVRPVAHKGLEAPMMTLFGASIILQNLLLVAFAADTRAIETPYAAQSLALGAVVLPKVYVVGCIVAVACVVAVHQLVARTRFGRELRSSAVDPAAAAVMGVDVARVHARAFALGAACAAMGGVLVGTVFSFSPGAGAPLLLVSFAIVVLGGIGNIGATLLAGMGLGAVQGAGALALGDGWRDPIGLAVLLLVLAVRPQGLSKQVAT